MSIKNKSKTSNIISEEVIRKIDMINDEKTTETEPYKAHKKTLINNSELFDKSVYEEHEESGVHRERTFVIAVVCILAVAIITVGILFCL